MALPPPMMSYPASNVPPPPTAMAYYPVYPHQGHFYIASPPLHPTSPSHPTKILPKIPSSPISSSTTTTTSSSSSSSSNQNITSTTSTTASPLPSPSMHPTYTFYPYPITSPTIHPTAHHHPAILSPGMTATPITIATGPTTSSNMTTADQREQARKVSHSAIERRRRERINDKIMQLKHLIPTCANQENLHKMSILQSAIDYITYLKQVLKENHENDDGDENNNNNKNINSSIKKSEVLDLLHGKLQVTKTTKSMLPKEVEPFTNQFNIKATISSPSSTSDHSSHHSTTSTTTTNNNNNSNKIERPVSPPLSNEENQKAIKPLDLLIHSNNNNKSNIPSLPTNDLLLTPALTPKTTATNPPSPTNLSSSSSSTTLNMSVKNLLC
ncbi:unnamed protein product [Cunninghamella blakesleeana]